MSINHAVACQSACPEATSKEQLKKNVDYGLDFVRSAVSTFSSTAPVKLAVFPESAFSGYPGRDANEQRKYAVEIPGEESERFIQLAKELDMYIMTGSWIERDTEYKLLFNTAYLVGPQYYCLSTVK